ncbi:MAG: heavy-metal-associated domain-containing protein [Chloroflexota bacterium]
METKTFKIPNIGCDGCISKIKQEVGSLAGIIQVEADKDSKIATVQWQAPASWSLIETRLMEIDYAPEEA